MKKLSLLLCMLLIFCVGCSSSKSVDEQRYVSNGYSVSEKAVESYESVSSMAPGYVSEEYDPDTNTISGKKIIYSANTSLETKNYDQDKVVIDNLLTKYNVIIDNSSETDHDNAWWYYEKYQRVGVNGRNYSIQLRVNVTDFDNFLNDLRGTGIHLTGFNVYSNDVTKTYNDNKDKIESLETQQKRLLELLSEAQNVTEILEIEDRLADIRWELKYLNDNNTSIDYDVQYSKVSISLKEVNRYTTDDYSFGDRVLDSLEESWDNVVEFAKNLIIFAIFVFPFVLIAAVIIFIINRIRIKKGKEKFKIRNLYKKNKVIAIISTIFTGIAVIVLIAVIGSL